MPNPFLLDQVNPATTTTSLVAPNAADTGSLQVVNSHPQASRAIVGECASSNGAGVLGISQSGNGVVGASRATGVAGLYGVNQSPGGGIGVWGRGRSDYGVFGESDNTYGVVGVSSGKVGVVGGARDPNWPGVFGGTCGPGDVIGPGPSVGVSGNSTSNHGVMGTSQVGHGIHGEATSVGVGVYAACSAPGGWALLANGEGSQGCLVLGSLTIRGTLVIEAGGKRLTITSDGIR